MHLERGIPQAISTIIHYSVLLLGFFVALAVLGLDLTDFPPSATRNTTQHGFILHNYPKHLSFFLLSQNRHSSNAKNPQNKGHQT